MSNEVLIVGAGPVGLITALLLAKVGVQVTIVEAEAGIVDSPRAMTYAWSVLDGLEVHGLLDDMIAAGFLNHDRAFRVFRTGETILHRYDVLQGLVFHPYTLTLGQNRLAEVVLSHLSRYPNATIRWNTRLVGLEQDARQVTARVEGPDGPERIEAAWLVGCDGGRSGVRKEVGLGFEGITWPRRFVATNIYHEGFAEHQTPSGYLIDPKWGAVNAQITEEGLWRVTYSEDETLPLDGVRDRIDAFMKKTLPGKQDYELMLYSAYSMHQRTAPTYRVGRVLLSGDASHVTNPTSGFGLVGGMYDAFCLGEALTAVVREGHDDEILDRYSTERRNIFLGVTSPMSSDSMRLIFYCDNPVRLEHDLITLRHRATDTRALRQAQLAPAALETPSLVTGKTFAERLREQGRTPDRN
ncbi:MAG: 2-polyprenyl-6-methoxyphenol hydroxylase-like oxidoreductase [Alphaproteobacteria bacterium]|nr:2-polyprenyl-6-methoxyphenol hydroxylase-like oxidoreductase [Alphaproteobacteria bacterium]